MKIKIGSVELEGNIFLAPMAGVTDKTFRGICAEFGCGLTYSEMISAKGLNYNNKNTKALLEIDEREKFKAIQLFGHEPDILAEMAKRLEELPIDIIDINMGCPASKIVKNGDGSSLMKNPKLIGEIVEKVSKSVKKPVTVKFRKGVDEESINAVEVAKIAEESGAAALCVHGRTANQFYSGVADWDIIAEVKKAVKIPVIGNGDVTDALTCEKILKTTGCDGVMIGRGAQGNPWVFAEINHYFETGEILPPPTAKMRIDMALIHAKRIIENKGEYIGMREMRKHLGWYVKGMAAASELRLRINTVKTYDDVQNLFDEYLKG